MESLDTTILNTAVPTISAALGVAPLSMKAVLASYTLSLAVFIPISGWMADRFGTRRVFTAAIGLFTLGSFLCGLSSNIHVLVACRVLQGCGGAMMVPVGRLIVLRNTPKERLAQTIAYISWPGLSALVLGPPIGGMIENLEEPRTFGTTGSVPAAAANAAGDVQAPSAPAPAAAGAPQQ